MKKIFLSILIVFSLFIVTAYNNENKNNNQNTNNNTANNNQKGEYWYMNKTLTLTYDASNDGTKVTFSSPNEKGEPTKVTINGGAKLDGRSIDGTHSLNLTDCNEEMIIGKMYGNVDESIIGFMLATIKGELKGDSKILLVDISF